MAGKRQRARTLDDGAIETKHFGRPFAELLDG